MARTLNKLFDELEEAKQRFGSSDKKILRALRDFSTSELADADSLIRLHERLLFLRAYPTNPKLLQQVEETLNMVRQRVSQLTETDVDLSPADDPEVSGIAGTSVTSNFSYALVRWLVAKYPRQLSIDWDWFEEEDRFGAVIPRFLPLLEEDAMVEAHVPYREWLRAGTGKKNEIAWLVERFEALAVGDRAKAELYDSLKLHINWRFGNRSSRTGMRLPVRSVFYHDQPLIQRREVSLVKELDSPPIPVRKLSAAEGEKILDMARETSAVRYRELHGFTYGEGRRVLRADLGRGTEAFVMGVPARNRLPLRAYHAAIIFKNGVPVAYFEGLSLFERMESGFNLYYTFREGETAWLYARILRLMRQLLGVTVFSIDPYQVGHENEEGIESGAFWFYRKLGFWPVQPELMKQTMAEERKLATRKGYRTSARTLRKLAAGHLVFDLNSLSRPRPIEGSEWDTFTVRQLGLAVQQRMAADFDSNDQQFRAAAVRKVSHTLGIGENTWTETELAVVRNLSLILVQIPQLDRWNAGEKKLAAQIIRAKASAEEANYLRLMQRHEPLRRAVMEMGSNSTKLGRRRARD